jgi:hypothetical protein
MENKRCGHEGCGEDETVLSYITGGPDYRDNALKFLAGLPGNRHSLGNPRDAMVPIDRTLPNLTVHSLVFRNEVVMVMGKVVSQGGAQPSSSKYALLGLPRRPQQGWAVLGDNISLEYPAGTPAATNIQGLVQVGDWAYGADYDSRKVLIMRVNELNGLFGVSHTLEQEPFDLGAIISTDILPATAVGWDIVALRHEGTDYLFVLYNGPDSSTAGSYKASVLVRIQVNPDGSLTYVDNLRMIPVLNAQGLAPVIAEDGTVSLFIPSIGGMQQAGATNGPNSQLTRVKNIFDTSIAMAAYPLLMGNTTPPATGSDGDVAGFVAAMRPGGVAYIRAGLYNGGYYSDGYIYYKTTVTKLLALEGSPMELFDAFTQGILEIVDEGAVASSSSFDDGILSSGIYFHDMLIVHGDCAEEDELFVFKGSKLEVHSVLDYGSRHIVYGLGYGEGHIGGANVNSADATGESERQIKAGMHHKHGARLTRIGPAALGAEEEEKDTAKK